MGCNRVLEKLVGRIIRVEPINDIPHAENVVCIQLSHPCNTTLRTGECKKLICLNLNSTKDIPYLAIMGVFCGDFGENWSCYNYNALYIETELSFGHVSYCLHQNLSKWRKFNQSDIPFQCIRVFRHPADTRRKNNVIMTSKRCRFDVIMTLILPRAPVGHQLTPAPYLPRDPSVAPH